MIVKYIKVIGSYERDGKLLREGHQGRLSDKVPVEPRLDLLRQSAI